MSATRVKICGLRDAAAVDAAVATAFAITVVEPNASSLGGEGYMVLSLADGRNLAIDFRSWAPGRVTLETDASVMFGPEGTCIPGLVAGLTLALQEYGTKPLHEVLAPAIRLARDGFPLDAVLYDRLTELYGFTDYGMDPLVGTLLSDVPVTVPIAAVTLGGHTTADRMRRLAFTFVPLPGSERAGFHGSR